MRRSTHTRTGTLAMLAAVAAVAALVPLAAAHDGVGTDDPASPGDGTVAGHFSDPLLSAADSAFAAGKGGEQRATRTRNVSLVGQLSFGEQEQGFTNTDVWAHGDHAYVGTFSSPACAGDLGLGVKIVDVSEPSSPQWIGTLASPAATRANDVKVARVDTAAFHGDLLVHTNEPCRSGGDGGIRLYDVSDPANPVHLSDFYSIASRGPGPGPTAFGVHNAYIVEQGNRAYVLVVANISPDAFDTRIVDVTDPRAPTEAGRWSSTQSPDAPAGVEPRGTSRSLGLHDVWASDDGKTAYLSYWDAGYVLLDISDPASPRFLGSSTWQDGDEGNAHAAVPARGGNLLVATDEDFSATGLGRVDVNAGPHAGERYEAVVGAISPSFAPLTADVAWVGRGCAGDPYLESPTGKIALVQRGACTFTSKVERAAAEGALGVIVFNNAGDGLVLMGGTPVSIPAVFVAQSRGERLAADREAGETVNVTMREGEFDGWGFARVFDISDPANVRLLSTIELPSTRDPAAPNPFGVHNVYVRGNTAYFSWYRDGFVAVDISQPASPRVIAHFDEENNFWGIHAQRDLVFASDRDKGLFVFKFKP